MREVVIDTETTGLSHKGGDRIIEVACLELINHVATDKYLQFYCSTDKIIKKESEAIHGISNDFLNKFPTFTDQAKKLLDFIKMDTLIIHNAEFDLGFINNELKLSGFQPLQNKFIDTVSLARKKLNTRVANLDYLCRRFSINLGSRNIHGALLDSRLLSEVYLELLGGRQTHMDLANPTKNINNPKDKKEIIKNKIHKIQISSEEIRQHKDFVNKLKNALWQKIEY